MDLKEVLAIAWKRKLALIVVVLVAVGASAAFAFSIPKKYQSTVTLALTPNVQKGQGFVASDNLATLLSTYAAIAASDENKARAERILGHPLDADVSASSTAGSGILKISAVSSTPAQATESAGALSQAFQQAIQNNQLLVVQVADPPSVPSAPVQPRPPLIIGAGLVLGLGVGLAFVLVFDRWFGRIESTEDLAQTTVLPVLAHIPRHRALRHGPDSMLIWDNHDLVRVQEAIRNLRTNLQLLIGSSPVVLQVTSSSPRDGKSMIAANLAVAVASVGIRTLLVDADFRHPCQHAIFGLQNDRGLSDLMLGPGVHSHPTRFPNLSVLPSGPLPRHPADVMHTRLAGAIGSMRKTATFIVIDTPPVLPVSDTGLVATQADLVLLVVVAGRTKAVTLRQTLTRLQLLKAELAGVVLNQVTETTAAAGYDGYYAAAAAQLPDPA